MSRKSWNIVLVPEGGGSVRSLRIPVRFLQLACGVLALGLVAVAGSVGIHLWSLQGMRALKSLRRENATLRIHLQAVDQTLGQMERVVREGQEMERQARLLAGMPLEDASQPPLGQGGPLVRLPGDPASVDPALRSTVEEQSRRLESLTQRASSQRRNLEQTLTTLKGLGTRLEHTPSIAPLRGPSVLSSGFGYRPDPFTGQRAFHSGLDLRAQNGTPVHVTAAGQVTRCGHDGEFGLTVRVDHGYGFETVYCHLSASRVQVGDVVKRGDVIGSVGSTGRSTGSHLHYEVWSGGAPRDPAAFILTGRGPSD